MGMDLHSIVAPIVGIVNDNVTGVWYRSEDYTTAPSGKREPAYAIMDAALDVQVQAVEGETLKQVDSLNIQGIKRSFFASADIRGADRAAKFGGDILQFGNTDDVPAPLQNTSWLIVLVVEPWSASGWTHSVGVQQDDPIPLVTP
jgi:hypothetical protein